MEDEIPAPPKPDITQPFPAHDFLSPDPGIPDSAYPEIDDPYESQSKTHVQMLAYGPQDLYLYDRHGTRPYVAPYNTHTPFAIDHIDFPFQDVFFGRRLRIPLSTARFASGLRLRPVDLFGRLFLEVQLPVVRLDENAYGGSGTPEFYWTNGVGFALLEHASLTIEEDPFDEMTSQIIDVDHELDAGSNYDIIAKLVGKYETDNASELRTDVPRTVFVPLPFLHGKPGHPFLPLFAIQNTNVFLDLKFRHLEELVRLNPLEGDEFEHVDVQLRPRGALFSATLNVTRVPMIVEYDGVPTDDRDIRGSLYADMIALHGPEKTSVKMIDQEMLWKARHAATFELSGGRDSFFVMLDELGALPNRPVSEVVVLLQSGLRYRKKRHLNYELDPENHAKRIWLTIEGQEYGDGKNALRKDNYERLTRLNAYRHHTRVPRKEIYVIPLCLEPTEYQPTGAINFARTKRVRLNLEFDRVVEDNLVVTLISTYYSVLRIRDGQLQKAFL